jgi:hypothetical protein
VACKPRFAEYAAKPDRVFPVFRLNRV